MSNLLYGEYPALYNRPEAGEDPAFVRTGLAIRMILRLFAIRNHSPMPKNFTLRHGSSLGLPSCWLQLDCLFMEEGLPSFGCYPHGKDVISVRDGGLLGGGGG